MLHEEQDLSVYTSHSSSKLLWHSNAGELKWRSMCRERYRSEAVTGFGR